MATFTTFVKGLLKREISAFANKDKQSKDEDSVYWKSLKNEQFRMRATISLVMKNLLKN